MADPIQVANLVFVSPNHGHGLTEYTRGASVVQAISEEPGSFNYHITQLCEDLLLTPESSGNVQRISRTGVDLGTFISATEFGAGAIIWMAQCDFSGRLIVLYEESGAFKIKRFNQDGTIETDFGGVSFADDFHNDYLQQTADISEDGNNIYVAAGEFKEDGTVNIPIYKIILNGDGTTDVIDRWGIAISGPDPSPGGGLPIDGATIIHTSGITSVVVANRIYPAPQHGDGGTGHSGGVIQPGETITLGGDLVVPFTQQWWVNFGNWSGPTGTPLLVEVIGTGISATFGAGVHGVLGYPLGSDFIEGDTVITVAVTNMSPDTPVLLDPIYGDNFINIATHEMTLEPDQHTFTPVDTISNVRYRLKQFDVDGVERGNSIIYRPPWQGGHKAFMGIPRWACKDAFLGFWYPLGYDDVEEGTFLFFGSFPVTSQLFGGTPYDHIPLWAYWSSSECNLVGVDLARVTTNPIIAEWFRLLPETGVVYQEQLMAEWVYQSSLRSLSEQALVEWVYQIRARLLNEQLLVEWGEPPESVFFFPVITLIGAN